MVQLHLYLLVLNSIEQPTVRQPSDITHNGDMGNGIDPARETERIIFGMKLTFLFLCPRSPCGSSQFEWKDPYCFADIDQVISSSCCWGIYEVATEETSRGHHAHRQRSRGGLGLTRRKDVEHCTFGALHDVGDGSDGVVNYCLVKRKEMS